MHLKEWSGIKDYCGIYTSKVATFYHNSKFIEKDFSFGGAIFLTCWKIVICDFEPLPFRWLAYGIKTSQIYGYKK
jgi:hypothetical protein